MTLVTERRTYARLGRLLHAYRQDIAHFGKPYMRRWIVRTPLGMLRLHHIVAPDGDRHLHDHPFSFVSLVLRGGYIEERPSRGVAPHVADEAARSITERSAGSIAYRRAADAHRIRQVERGGCWTLVATGPLFRRWGFWVPAGAGRYTWRHWEEVAHEYA